MPSPKEILLNQALMHLDSLKKERVHEILKKCGLLLFNEHVPHLTLREIEKLYLQAVYKQCGERKDKTSEWLGISRVTLWRMLDDLEKNPIPSVETLTREMMQNDPN